jgi:G3E family GTPase
MRNNEAPLDQHSRIPLTIVAGAPRAGKSTLVRHLLERTAGRRIAAIVADARAVSAAMIARREDGCFILDNGCLCVVAEDDSATTLAAVARREQRPEHVIVDGAGWADPRRLAGYGYMPGYHLDGTVVVLDAGTVRHSEGDAGAESQLREQVRIADLVVLNKVDLIGERETDGAHAVLERLCPNTRIVWCDHAKIAPPLLIGLSDGPSGLDGHGVLAPWTADYAPLHLRARGGRARQVERHRGWCLTRAEPIEAREFREWVHRLPPTIIHGRGSVYLREEPQHRQVFHLFGAHWRLERGGPWGHDVPATRVLLAGLGGAERESVRTRATLATDRAGEFA